MKKDRLYLWSFLSLLIIVFFVGYYSINYLIEISTEQFLSVQIASSKREAKEMAKLVSFQLENGVSRETIIKNVQNSIKDTETDAGFLCMFDSTGKEVCNPYPERIGKRIKPGESFITAQLNNVDGKDFLDFFIDQKAGGGIRNFKNLDRKSEIIYVYPVENSDLIMAAHANLSILQEEIANLKRNFLFVYGGTSAVIVLLALFSVRLIGSNYEKHLETKNEKLSQDVINLSKLNIDLASYKEKIQEDRVEATSGKDRILTYKSNQLVPLEVVNIAYIYLENSITYIMSDAGVTSNSNSSLDELFKDLDPRIFFRANRKFIISINAIEKVMKYGNNQLKIEITPQPPIAIIISKNKASEFKQWLDS